MPWYPRYPQTSIHVDLVTQPTTPHDCQTRKVLPQSTITRQRHRQSEAHAILSPEKSMLQNSQPMLTGKRTKGEIATRHSKKNVFHHHSSNTQGGEASSYMQSRWTKACSESRSARPAMGIQPRSDMSTGAAPYRTPLHQWWLKGFAHKLH